MTLIIYGSEVGNEDDPVQAVPAQPLDQPVILGKISKERREDLQILAFATSSLNMVSEHSPLEILAGEDPPDRIVRVGAHAVAVELTELTITDVRRELASARQLGRRLQERLRQSHSRYGHLVGRVVSLLITRPDELPRNQESLIEDLCLILTDDKGCVGDGIDFSQRMPDPWPNDFGFYGQQGPVTVTVSQGGLPHDLFVSSSCQSQIRLSEAIKIVGNRVQDKDIECNRVLLMSCGLPDNNGAYIPA